MVQLERMKTKKNKTDLSIIIVSFNVKKLLLNCLESVYKSKPTRSNWQVIVVDNASTDNSISEVKNKYPQVEILESKTNLGFSAANNLGVQYAKGKFILFLNPDTLINNSAIQKSLRFIQLNPRIGGLTCKVSLPNGSLDYSCHRGFPTPWNSFCYFTGLSKLFPHSKLFSGYSATYLNISKIHEIDCCSGVFLIVRKQAGDMINWWDEDYFWNGEDIEFCYQLKEKGWKIYFYPEVKITHFKGSSSGLWKTGKTKVTKEVRIQSTKSASEAMRIFYKKHYGNSFVFFRMLTLLGTSLLEKHRLLKIRLAK